MQAIGPAIAPNANLVSRLRSEVRGRVITAHDPDYDATRMLAAGGYDLHPQAIVRVAGAHDVSRVIGVARATGLPLAVRSGGHSSAGHSSTEGGIVIDLRDMKSLEIDPREQTAWAETGLTAAEVTRTAGERGLAVGFGDTGSVGIGGITLGGGIGFLVRKHGLTIDSLLAAELVTADGRVLHVDDTTHPDLFWAIRGGGGNFGVATRFKFRLHPVPQVVGGILVLPASAEVIAGFMEAAEAAPDELSTIANVMAGMPLPFLPEEAHGKPILMAFMSYAGDAEDGERAVAPFRGLAAPLSDMVRPMAYPEMYPVAEGESDYHPTAVGRTFFMDRVGAAEAQTVDEYIRSSDASMRAVQLRALGGAMARVPADATAFAHRSSRILAVTAAFYDGPDDRAMRQAWVDGLASALRQTDAGAYVNFVGDEGDEGVRAAYPAATLERLAAIKAEYDPDNLFRLNQNVRPAARPAERPGSAADSARPA